MTVESNWNSSGVRVHYGTRTTEEQYGGQISTSGNEKVLEWIVDYTSFTTGVYDSYTTAGALTAAVPAGAIIKEALIQVVDAVSGNSIDNFDVGLNFATETDDPNGLDDAVAVAAGTIAIGDGALVGTELVEDGYLVVSTFATATPAQPTAGKIRVQVTYVDSKD